MRNALTQGASARATLTAIALTLAGAGLAGAGHAQTAAQIPFESVPHPVQLPANTYLGEVTGVAVNSKHHIFVFSRANTTGPAYGAAAAQLLEFAPDGRFIREIGRNLYAWASAHTVKIDAHDNIWVTDKGSDMVVEFDPEGRVIMVVGRKQEASDPTGPLPHPNPPLPPVAGMFRQVTDMTWDAAGNTYISDGYINSRVVKLDKEGNWVASWGEPGSGPGQFNVPHSIASDNAGNIYVADRGNRRIQVFDGTGKFLRQMTIDLPAPADARRVFGAGPRPAAGAAPAGGPTAPAGAGTQQPGSPWAICITPGPVQYLYSADAYPGRIYKLSLDGHVLGWLGATGKTLGKFAWIHQLACPSENELWVADLLNWRVQKLILRPDAASEAAVMRLPVPAPVLAPPPPPPPPPAPPAAPLPAPDVTLAGSMIALESAWNAKDGKAWGDAFWPDADSINVYGVDVHGSAAIGARHTEVFAGRMKDTTMSSHLLIARRLSPDSAVLGLTQDIAAPNAVEPLPKLIRVFATVVTQRRGGVWKILLMQNTSLAPIGR